MLNKAYKLHARVTNKSLNKIADVLLLGDVLLGEENDFRKGRSGNDNVTINQLIDKYRKHMKKSLAGEQEDGNKNKTFSSPSCDFLS